MAVASPKQKIVLRHETPPHSGARGFPGQTTWLQACLHSEIWATCIALGRKSGKTHFVKYLLIEEGADPRFAGIRYEAAYMAHQHSAAEDFFDDCVESWKQSGLLRRAHSSQGQDRYVILNPWGESAATENAGARIWFVSGDPVGCQGFYGKNLHRGVIDEAGQVPEIAYKQVMMPMFITTRGKPLVIGTPYPDGPGFAWFEEFFLKGVVGSKTYDDRFLSFNAPSECNPFNSLEFVKQMRADFAGDTVAERCHIDGLFAKDSGAVFQHLDTTFTLSATRELSPFGERWVHRAPKEGENVVIGLDFAESIRGDASIASSISIDSREQIEALKFRGVEYEDQLPVIDALFRRMGPNALVVADGRVAGGHIVNVLRRRYGERIHVVKWASGGQFDKATDVVHGVHLCQASAKPGALSWRLMDIEEQKEEFRLYGRKALPSGGWKYEAPSGKHDDWVSANLFAARRLPVIEQIPAEEGDDTKFDLTGMEPGTVANHLFMLETQKYPQGGGVYTLR